MEQRKEVASNGSNSDRVDESKPSGPSLRSLFVESTGVAVNFSWYSSRLRLSRCITLKFRPSSSHLDRCPSPLDMADRESGPVAQRRLSSWKSMTESISHNPVLGNHPALAEQVLVLIEAVSTRLSSRTHCELWPSFGLFLSCVYESLLVVLLSGISNNCTALLCSPNARASCTCLYSNPQR